MPTKAESEVKFVIGHSLWDDSDYVVTIRPDYEKVWRSLPLGGTLSERRARLIAEWLQGAMPTLWKIFEKNFQFFLRDLTHFYQQ